MTPKCAACARSSKRPRGRSDDASRVLRAICPYDRRRARRRHLGIRAPSLRHSRDNQAAAAPDGDDPFPLVPPAPLPFVIPRKTSAPPPPPAPPRHVFWWIALAASVTLPLV